MRNFDHKGSRNFASTLLLCALLLPFSAAVADKRTPHGWLESMSSAVHSTNYEGTVIRLRDGSAEALKVIHLVADGVVREKLIAQEGNGLEIVRIGNEVHCILPDTRSVLVEEWDEQSTLFSTLPSSKSRFGSEYDVAIVREERVAGRNAILLAIRPHDEFRYGHRIWLDVESAFPLQTQLIDGGNAIAQIKFAEISINKDIAVSELAPSYHLDSFTWFTDSRRVEKQAVSLSWYATDLPAGFRVVSAHAEKMPPSEEVVTHVLYGDGVATVSVFIAGKDSADIKGQSNVGSTHSYSVVNGDYVITAVGEVPAATVRRIATSMVQD